MIRKMATNRVKREYKLATWELITSEIERLLTIERTTGYKIKPRLNHETITPVAVVGVRFVCNKEGGWWGKWGKPISVEICEMDIVLRDGVPQFKINNRNPRTACGYQLINVSQRRRTFT